MLAKFAEFLRENKDKFCTKKEVLVEQWDPTYGLQDPRVETMELIEFDALCAAMDEFSESMEEHRRFAAGYK